MLTKTWNESITRYKSSRKKEQSREPHAIFKRSQHMQLLRGSFNYYRSISIGPFFMKPSVQPHTDKPIIPDYHCVIIY